MKAAYSELIRQIQSKVRKLDLFLSDNVNPDVLTELNGSNNRTFFSHQLHDVFVKTAETINEVWQLNLDLAENSNADDILVLVLDELTKKLKNEPPEYSDDVLRAVMGIVYLESRLLSSIADKIKKDIKAEQRVEFYNSLVKPFNDVWVFIRNTIGSLITNLGLLFQTRAGVDFQHIKQSTHLACVHKSVTRSLNLLDARNPKPTDAKAVKALEKSTVEEIESHIKTMNLSAEQKNYAFNTLERAKDDRAVEHHSGRTIMETLITMWTAAQVSDVYSREDTVKDSNERKDLIIKHLAFADREYNMDMNGNDLGGESAPACLGGTVNKIVESLEIIHPDVRIIRGQNILSDFTMEAFEAEFKKLSSEKQFFICGEKYLEKHLKKDSGNLEYIELIKGIKSIIEGKLKDINETIFGGEIPIATLNAYLDNIGDIRVPETEAVIQFNKKINDILPQFNMLFDIMIKDPFYNGLTDISLAMDCVKNTYAEDEDPELWNTEEKLLQLAELMLAYRNEGLANIQEGQKAKEIADNILKVQSELTGDTATEIIVDDHKVTSHEFKVFNDTFDSLKKIPLYKSSRDIFIAKSCVIRAFLKELWDKDNNLEQLATQLLARRNEGLANIQEVPKAKEIADNKLKVQSELTGDTATEIIVDDHKVTPDEFKKFNDTFDTLKKLPAFKSYHDNTIANRCVKASFLEKLWDKDNNLEQLATQLLARRNEGLANIQEGQKATEVSPVIDEGEERQSMHGMK